MIFTEEKETPMAQRPKTPRKPASTRTRKTTAKRPRKAPAQAAAGTPTTDPNVKEPATDQAPAAPTSAITQEELEAGKELLEAHAPAPAPVMDAALIDLVATGVVVFKGGEHVPTAEIFGQTEGTPADGQTEQTGPGDDPGTVSEAEPDTDDQDGDAAPESVFATLDVISVAANTAQAAAAEVVLQLMAWPQVDGDDGPEPDPAFDPEYWYAACLQGWEPTAIGSATADWSVVQALADYAAQRPGVVSGEALYRWANAHGLNVGARDGFHDLPEPLQLAYILFAQTAWHTACDLQRLKDHTQAALGETLPAEPGRAFPLTDDDEPTTPAGQRGFR